MSVQYDNYLRDHVTNVKKAWNWMADQGIISGLPGIMDSARFNIFEHDDSKRSLEEYDAYDDYFYGKEDKDEDDIAVIDSAFDYAWLHHIHHNPHHWQYWVLFEDEGKTRGLEMPPEFIFEMIADWWSFSWKNDNLYEIFDWYEKHREKMILGPKTRDKVEAILNDIHHILDKEKDEST